jgi:Flp pilus assembly pilin Flp
MRVLIRWLVRSESGQDLVEWALLVAFVALGSTALMTQSGSNMRGVWTSATVALQSQVPSGTTPAQITTPAPITTSPPIFHRDDDRH